MAILAHAGLKTCRFEDFSLSAGAEMAQVALDGRFVLSLQNSIFAGEAQAISLRYLIFMGAASFC